MIARARRCTASVENEAAYLRHFHESVVPELAAIDGYRGAYVLRRALEGGVELTVMTLWESLDTIRQFAGEDVDRAVVASVAQAVLRSFEKTVTHYEIIVQPAQVQ